MSVRLLTPKPVGVAVAQPAKRIRVFVASPSDVQEERDSVSRVIDELNLTLSALLPKVGAVLEFVRWETHTHPAAGDPQSVILSQIGEYDIFLGIMWKRFGTKTLTADSGTEEEFNHAFELWQRKGEPHVMFYFCRKPFAMPTEDKDFDQIRKVAAFKKVLSTKGLIWDYPDAKDFRDIVRPHLISVLGTILNKQTPESVAERVLELGGDTTSVREQIGELAREYERRRDAMDAGPDRTGEMETVLTQMRTLASTAYPLLDELFKSERPGDRLAAIAILEVIPRAQYLDWLARRFEKKAEKPFVGYHAAAALLTAARALSNRHWAEVAGAIEGAKNRHRLANPDNYQHTDRYDTLLEAEQALRKRQSPGRADQNC